MEADKVAILDSHIEQNDSQIAEIRTSVQDNLTSQNDPVFPPM